jgi:hypothetical protein
MGRIDHENKALDVSNKMQQLVSGTLLYQVQTGPPTLQTTDMNLTQEPLSCFESTNSLFVTGNNQK